LLVNRIWLDESIVLLASITLGGCEVDYNGPGFVPFGFPFFWMLPLFVIFAVGLTVLVIWAVRSSGRPAYPIGPAPMPAAPRETPLEILARRFASGEISAEEYLRARDLLGGGGKP
jgi:uncharacterized membrane protein